MFNAHSYSYFTVRDSIVSELLDKTNLDAQVLTSMIEKVKAMASFYNLDYEYEKSIILSKYYKLSNRTELSEHWRSKASARWSETLGIANKIPVAERLI